MGLKDQAIFTPGGAFYSVFRDQAFLVWVQEAVVARPPENLGQDVLQQQVQEVGAGQAADFRLYARGVPVAEADQAVAVRIAGDDLGFRITPQ